MAMEIKIDGYDSFEQIAVGGMAAVYKARRISIDKTVAIKVLFPYLASDASFIDRFQREAKSAARIQHENIVNVVDFGGADGCYYIVMEFYEGLTIAELLEDQPRIPLDIAACIVLDVCLGLEAAHSQGIVHRDIKPGNIIFTKQGGIKIADFGLAKRSGAMTVVTQPGKVLGTPAYMSPEQAAGEDVGPQSDLFSLGVVAYELFCHKKPFDGSSYSEVVEKIQTRRAPSLAGCNPLIQPDFEHIVTQMMEKEPSRRYGSAFEVIADLERTMEKFDIKRDRRRLQRYVRDPAGYLRAFNGKMLGRCLSQGTYYMQKGKTHLAEATLEFKRILYLDPTNDRAKRFLAEIRSQRRTGAATTVTMDAARRGGQNQETPRATSTGASPEKPVVSTTPAKPDTGRRRRSGHLAWLLPVAVLLAGGAGWGGWTGRLQWPGWHAFTASDSIVAPPVLEAPVLVRAAGGDTVTFYLEPGGWGEEAVEISGKDLPRGASLTSEGRFSWVVPRNGTGRHTALFEASGNERTARAQTVFEITEAPAGIDFVDPGAVRGRVGRDLHVPLNAISLAGRTVRFELEGAPSGMRIEGNTLLWTPRDGQAGTHRVKVRATDGLSEADQDAVLHVEGARPRPAAAASVGRLEWILPKLANIYVDGVLKIREDTYLSVELPEGRHTVRAELLDGMTSFDEVVDIRRNETMTLDPPKVSYGRLSVYFLGGVGELFINGSRFHEQPPFTKVVLPCGVYRVGCSMFRPEDSREFEVTVREGQNTIVEYEVGSEPHIDFESLDG